MADSEETMGQLIEGSIPEKGDVTYRRALGETWRIENLGTLPIPDDQVSDSQSLMDQNIDFDES